MAYTQAQLITFFTNANAGTAPSEAQKLALLGYANQSASGQLTEAQALDAAIALGANSTTAVGVQTYAFFTGVAPSVAGLTALNAAYAANGAQANLNAENRFIAQSVALATQNAAAKTAFATSYGSLSVAEATKAAYEIIIGTPAATAAGVNVANAVAYLSRAENVTYLTAFIKANTGLTAAADIDLAVKAAIVGQIMQAATSYNNGAGLGAYAQATDKLLADLADDGNLVANNAAGINLFTNYGTDSSTGGTPGQTIALTDKVDALTGTANDDTFTAVVGNNNTLNFGDVLDGGAGNDTLLIANDKATPTAISGLQIKNIETIAINNTSEGAANAQSINLAGVTGVTSVVSSGQGDVTVTNIGTSAAVGIRDVAYTATAAATVKAAAARSVSLSGVTIATGGTATVDVQDVAANLGTTLSVANTSGKAASITTLKYGGTDAAKGTTLSVNAGGAITIKTLTSGKADELKGITVTGGAKFTVTDDIAASAVLTTINASANTGGVSLSIADVTTVTSLKGGSGADTITAKGKLGATAVVDLGAGNDTYNLDTAVTSGAKISGGEGTDTLGLSTSASFNTDTKAAISGFEIVSLSGAAQNYDASLLTGFTGGIQVSGGSVTVSNAAANPTFTITGEPTTFTVTLADATGASDVVNLNLGVAGKNVGKITTGLTVTGVETVNINSINGTASGATTQATNVVKLAANADLAKVVITGNGAVSLDTTNVAHALNVDASAVTNFVTVTGGTTGHVLNVIGSNQNDTIVAGNSGGQINAGKGGDSITLGGGADIVILKAGDSVFDASTETAGAGNKSTMDSIANFNTAGADKLDLTQISGFGTTGQGVATATVATLADLTTKLGQADIFKDGGGLQRGVLAVTVGGADTYVVVDVNHDGAYNAGTDLVVKLAGYNGTLLATDINFGS